MNNSIRSITAASSTLVIAVGLLLCNLSSSSSLNLRSPLNGTNEQHLIHHVLQDYVKQGRPVHDPSKAIVVKINFALLQIKELKEKEQVLVTKGWLEVGWVDEFIQWRPEDFGNTTYIALWPRDMWHPEIAIGNTVYNVFDKSYEDIRIIILSNGSVFWWPGGLFHTSCKINIFYFPFDDQQCTITIQQWTHFEDKVFMTYKEKRVLLSEFVNNGQWLIIDTSVARTNATYALGTMSIIHFNIYLRRRSTFIVVNILIPCVMIAALDVMVFYLAPDSGEKIGLGTTVLLALTIFLLLVADIVPRTSDAVPVITLYLTALMGMTTLSVFCSVLILRIHHHDTSTPTGPMFKLLYKFMRRVVAPLVMKFPSKGHRQQSKDRYKDIIELDTPELNYKSECNSVAGDSAAEAPVWLRPEDCVMPTRTLSSNSKNSSSNVSRHPLANRPTNVTTRLKGAAGMTGSNVVKRRKFQECMENERLKFRFVAMVCDRVLLVLFLIANILVTVIILVVIPLSRPSPNLTHSVGEECGAVMASHLAEHHLPRPITTNPATLAASSSGEMLDPET